MLRHARLIAGRELRETVREPNLVLPLVLMPCLIGFAAGLSVFASFAPDPGAVGTAVTTAALDRLPDAAVQHLSNVPSDNRQATIQTLLKAFSIPLFWVIPVKLTPAVAADSFVGERERLSLEPLLATPISTTHLLLGKLVAAVVPATAGTWLGVLVLWAMTLVAGSPLYPRVLIADADWLFSLLVVAPLVALIFFHGGSRGAAVHARQWLPRGVPAERPDRVADRPGAYSGGGIRLPGDECRLRLRCRAVSGARRRHRVLGQPAV